MMKLFAPKACTKPVSSPRGGCWSEKENLHTHRLETAILQ
jgi:hypothetical protein